MLKGNYGPLALSSLGLGYVRLRLRHGVEKKTYHQISKRDWSLRTKPRGSTTPDRRPVEDLKLHLFPDSFYAQERSTEAPTKPAKISALEKTAVRFMRKLL
jgi:hypothetical protein